jgi:hypothetical protein
VGVGVVVEVGVGVGVIKLIGEQSKNDSKSKTEQLLVGVGVGVKQIPVEKYAPYRSGHSVVQGDLPDSKQSPPKVLDKHHCVVSVLK